MQEHIEKLRILTSLGQTCSKCSKQCKMKFVIDNCFHLFCLYCIREQNKKKCECPVCKKQFNIHQRTVFVKCRYRNSSPPSDSKHLIFNNLDERIHNLLLMKLFSGCFSIQNFIILASSTPQMNSPEENSDIIPHVDLVNENTNNESTRKRKQSHPRKIFKKNCPQQNEENTSVAFSGPSTSRGIPFRNSSSETSDDIECVELDGDEECQVVDVLKPRSERPHEIIDLDSDDESSNILSK